MNWNEFTQNCQLESTPVHGDCAVTALSSLGLIKVQGDDARDFLQGQLTNDITAVTPDQGQLSAWCTPKGRMLALLFIFQRGDDLYLQLPRELLETVLKRLRMFVMRAQVTLEDVSDELGIMAASGDCLADLLDNIPDSDFACDSSTELSFIRFPGNPLRLQVVGNAESLASLLEKLQTAATTISEQGWTLQNIRSAVPQLYKDTTEAFIPQMLNLDLLQGISFTKGCYTGQEVVARMKYLGQLKRRMYLARFESTDKVQAGDKLFSEQSKSAQGAGKIVSAVNVGDNQWEALVVTEIAGFNSAEIRLWDENGPVLNLSEPPYGLEAEE